MRVCDLANAATAEELTALLEVLYPEFEHPVALVREWQAAMRRPVAGPPPAITVTLHMAADWPSEVLRVQVNGLAPGNPAHLALDLTPWQEWHQMPVEDRTGLALDAATMAAHVCYEMTWHGGEDENERRRESVIRVAEEAEAAWKRGDKDYFVDAEEFLSRLTGELEEIIAQREGAAASQKELPTGPGGPSLGNSNAKPTE